MYHFLSLTMCNVYVWLCACIVRYYNNKYMFYTSIISSNFIADKNNYRQVHKF